MTVLYSTLKGLINFHRSVMKSIVITKFNLKNYILISLIFKVNGSFLSRMKNRYEYLPLTTKYYTVEDMDYIVDEVSPTNDTSKTTINNLMDSYQDNVKSTEYIKPTSVTKFITNSTKYSSELKTTIQELQFQKRTISSEADLYYYDQDKWPAIKLFVALTSTRFQQTPSATDSTKHRKRTWPPYFPPKFISKLQAELDDALLPWKSTTAIVTNVSTNISGNLTKGMDNAIPQLRYGTQASCYMCGLNQRGIPRMPGCYHIFESEDYRDRKVRQRFKVKCIKSKVKKRNKNKYYGPDYIGGCFKRFLDIGTEYNERGCRTKKPTKGKSYASKRLAYLERMLKNTRNGCVFSPYASLTPFSRAISLYARYHVCVCDTKYCNHSLRVLQSNFYKLFSMTLYAFTTYNCK